MAGSRLTITPTEHFFMQGDVTVRMWTGTAEDGIPVLALVAAVIVTAEDTVALPDLVAIPPPDEQRARIWAETVLARDQEP